VIIMSNAKPTEWGTNINPLLLYGQPIRTMVYDKNRGTGSRPAPLLPSF